jgi:hypothetical protein
VLVVSVRHVANLQFFVEWPLLLSLFLPSKKSSSTSVLGSSWQCTSRHDSLHLIVFLLFLVWLSEILTCRCTLSLRTT